VEADRVKMQGTLQSRTSEAFTVHEIQVATGTAVREYVSPAGKVFAVTWNGPFHPDLRQLLGAYYDQYVQAVQAQRASRRGHGPVTIQENGLVVQIAGHPRSFSGRAYVTSMVPSNIHLDDLQ